MKTEYNKPDWKRIAHLFKLGIIASLIALIGGDMILGWGTPDLSMTGMAQFWQPCYVFRTFTEYFQSKDRGS